MSMLVVSSPIELQAFGILIGIESPKPWRRRSMVDPLAASSNGTFDVDRGHGSSPRTTGVAPRVKPLAATWGAAALHSQGVPVRLADYTWRLPATTRPPSPVLFAPGLSNRRVLSDTSSDPIIRTGV